MMQRQDKKGVKQMKTTIKKYLKAIKTKSILLNLAFLLLGIVIGTTIIEEQKVSETTTNATEVVKKPATNNKETKTKSTSTTKESTNKQSSKTKESNSNQPKSEKKETVTESKPTTPKKAPAKTVEKQETKPKEYTPKVKKLMDEQGKKELSIEDKNACKKAESYLFRGNGFSKNSLYKQLTSEYGEGFASESAAIAIAYVEDQGIDWKAEAYKKAERYLSSDSGFSKDGLYKQLSSEYGEEFTDEEAQYAIDKIYNN